MKLTFTQEPNVEAVSLRWHMPGAAHPSSLYLLPKELTPAQYPHAVCDLSRTAVFWGNKFTHYHGVDDCEARHVRTTAEADVVYCDTFKLLAILKTLHDRKVKSAVIETDRLSTVQTPSAYTIGQLARHANLRNPDYLGRTLKHFHDALKGGRRSFADLMLDLSRLVDRAILFANRDEFYFDGRRIENGCGYNGGVILHHNDYGIHT